MLTPNLRELGAAAANEKMPLFELDNIARVAERLRMDAGVDSMLVTLGKEGMLLVEGSDVATHIRAAPRAVYDVTGPGDTAVAIFGALLATGCTRLEAAVVANAAAGVAVGHVGTVAVPLSDIKQAVFQGPVQKLVSAVEAASQTRLWQSAGKRVVFTNGFLTFCTPATCRCCIMRGSKATTWYWPSTAMQPFVD